MKYYIYMQPIAAIGSTWIFFHPLGSGNINATVTNIVQININ